MMSGCRACAPVSAAAALAAELAQHLGEHHEEQRAEQGARHARDAEDRRDEQHGQRAEVEEVEAADPHLQGAEEGAGRTRQQRGQAEHLAASTRTRFMPIIWLAVGESRSAESMRPNALRRTARKTLA